MNAVRATMQQASSSCLGTGAVAGWALGGRALLALSRGATCLRRCPRASLFWRFSTPRAALPTSVLLASIRASCSAAALTQRTALRAARNAGAPCSYRKKTISLQACVAPRCDSRARHLQLQRSHWQDGRKGAGYVLNPLQNSCALAMLLQPSIAPHRRHGALTAGSSWRATQTGHCQWTSLRWLPRAIHCYSLP